MFCNKCGAKIPDGSKFCPKCGQSVNAAAGEKANPAPAAQAAQMPKAAAPKAEGLKTEAQKAGATASAAQSTPSAGATPNTGTDPANPLGEEYAKSVAAAAHLSGVKTDIGAFAAAAQAADFPFVYTGERLKDAKVQATISKMKTTAPVEVFIAGASDFGGKTFSESIAVTKNEAAIKVWNDNKRINRAVPFAAFFLCKAEAAKHSDKKLSFAFVFYNKAKNKGKTYKFDFMDREMNAKLDEGAVSRLEALFNTLSVTTGAEYALSDDPNVFDFEFVNPFYGIHTTVARSADGIIIGKQKADKDTGIQIPLETPVSIKRQAIEGIKIRNSFNIKMFACLAGLALLMGIIFGLIIWGILGLAIWIGGTVYAARKSRYRMLSVNRRDGTSFKVQIGQGEPNDSNYNALVNAIFG